MTEEQNNHLTGLLEWLTPYLSSKYIKGAEEHKTVLHRDYTAKQLADMAIEEAIDQLVYLYTLRSKL
jgi:hypothetical protein